LLDEKINFEFACPRCRRRRWPGRDPAGFQTGAAQQHEAETVLNIEWFELARRPDEHRAVGQHAVHVAQEQFHVLQTRVKFLGNLGGHEKSKGENIEH
jgi:hypothetical protein